MMKICPKCKQTFMVDVSRCVNCDRWKHREGDKIVTLDTEDLVAKYIDHVDGVLIEYQGGGKWDIEIEGKRLRLHQDEFQSR